MRRLASTAVLRTDQGFPKNTKGRLLLGILVVISSVVKGMMMNIMKVCVL